MNRSCKACLRGSERNPVNSVYCAQCGDELVYFVQGSFAEERIDIVGQNGNDGDHYAAHPMSAPPHLEEFEKQVESLLDDLESSEDGITIYPTKVVAYDADNDKLFTLTGFDEFTSKIEVHTLLGNGNIEAVTNAMRRALASMKLEG